MTGEKKMQLSNLEMARDALATTREVKAAIAKARIQVQAVYDVSMAALDEQEAKNNEAAAMALEAVQRFSAQGGRVTPSS